MKAAIINVNTRYELIHRFLEITKPFHKLRPLEMDVLSKIVDIYLGFKDKGIEDELALILLGDYKIKMQIKTELKDMDDSIFQNLLSSLRKKGALSGFKVNSAFIPDIKDETFVLQYKFKINGDKL